MDIIAPTQVAQTRLIQFRQDGQTRVALVRDAEAVLPLGIEGGTYGLAQRAIQEGRLIREIVEVLEKSEQVPYQGLIDAGVIMPPITHPDAAHCCVSGTGLTHLGSADTRDSMHVKLNDESGALTDSMRMFKLGLDGGRPDSGKIGAQPEWFYKGDG